MNLVVDTLLTQYTRAGSGKLVLVIPGWADTSAGWQAMQADLSRQYDVVVLDLPGFGGSQMPEAAWGLDEYALFVENFIAKLNSGMPYAIVGHSNGGALAIKVLARRNIVAHKLVLLASAGIRIQKPGRAHVLNVVAKTGKLLTAPLPDHVRRRLRSRLYSSVGSDMLVAEHMQETFKRIVASDIQHDANTLQLPALLIYGDTDTDTPPAYGRIFADLIDNAELRVLPRAGHFVHIDEPHIVGAAIKEFLKP